MAGNTLNGRPLGRQTQPLLAAGRRLRTGSAIDMATSLMDGPRESREPTTTKPIHGGLARRVRLTRVAGREQELRNDDRAFRP
jgi:hypothetical protein